MWRGRCRDRGAGRAENGDGVVPRVSTTERRRWAGEGTGEGKNKPKPRSFWGFCVSGRGWPEAGVHLLYLESCPRTAPFGKAALWTLT